MSILISCVSGSVSFVSYSSWASLHRSVAAAAVLLGCLSLRGGPALQCSGTSLPRWHLPRHWSQTTGSLSGWQICRHLLSPPPSALGHRSYSPHMTFGTFGIITILVNFVKLLLMLTNCLTLGSLFPPQGDKPRKLTFRNSKCVNGLTQLHLRPDKTWLLANQEVHNTYSYISKGPTPPWP